MMLRMRELKYYALVYYVNIYVSIIIWFGHSM